MAPNPRRARGFTLIELLVAIGIFSVVLVIVVGAISSVISANRKAQAVTSIVNNLSFTLESMTRALKTGSGPSIIEDPRTPGCGHEVRVTDSGGRPVAYTLDEDSGSIAVKIGAESQPSPITAPEIDVTRLDFCWLAGDQPGIIFAAAGTLTLGGTATPFHIQTTVEQRALNIPT